MEKRSYEKNKLCTQTRRKFKNISHTCIVYLSFKSKIAFLPKEMAKVTVDIFRSYITNVTVKWLH